MCVCGARGGGGSDSPVITVETGIADLPPRQLIFRFFSPEEFVDVSYIYLINFFIYFPPPPVNSIPPYYSELQSKCNNGVEKIVENSKNIGVMK